MRRALVVLTGLLLAGGALGLAPPAGAHALAQSSDPAPGSTVAHAPPAVTITFGERPEPALSSIHVLSSTGATFDTGKTAGVAGSPLMLRVNVKTLPKGVYTVTWRTVSSVDGHVATGAFAFGVQVAPSSATTKATVATASAKPKPLAIAARWALYLGAVLLAGAVFVGGVLHGRPTRSVLRLLVLGTGMAAAGTAAIVLIGHSDAGISWTRLFRTAVGHHLQLRLAAVCATVVLVALALMLRGAARRLLVGLAGLGGVAVMLADVEASHAAAGSRPTLNMALQLVHIVAAGLWMGGLAALLVATRGEPTDDKTRAVRRFASVAGIGLVTVFVTGIIRAAVEIGRWDKIFSTGFGQLVVAKVALIALLALLGARNHFRHAPAAGTSLRGLRRVGSTELVLGASALLVAAALVNLAPPVSARTRTPPAVRPLVLNGSDYGTTTRIRFQVSPGAAGFNQFTVRATDYDSAAPIRADVVQLGFSMPQRPDLGTSTLPLKRAGAGTYRADGANLSIFGTWKVTVLVQHGPTSVEVPFNVTTRIPPQQIDVNRAAGAPTVYTAHFTGGRTVQVYLDPGKAGVLNQLHVTYVGPNSLELPVPDTTVSLATAAGAPIQQLTVRRLDQGHFVADVTPKRGTIHVLAIGTTTDGEQLPTLITLPVA